MSCCDSFLSSSSLSSSSTVEERERRTSNDCTFPFIKMTHSSREMKRRRESSLRLRRHHRRREGAPFCAPLSFVLLFVLQTSSSKSFFVSSCVPTIRCPNGEDGVTTLTRTCRAEWQCTWSAIAPKTTSPKRFSLLLGLADILNNDS